MWSLEKGLVYFACGRNINNQGQCADYGRLIELMAPVNSCPIFSIPVILYSSPTLI